MAELTAAGVVPGAPEIGTPAASGPGLSPGVIGLMKRPPSLFTACLASVLGVLPAVAGGGATAADADALGPQETDAYEVVEYRRLEPAR